MTLHEAVERAVSRLPRKVRCERCGSFHELMDPAKTGAMLEIVACPLQPPGTITVFRHPPRR